MFQTATIALDLLGILAFTATGALVASRKQMDIVGFVVLGTVTGIGGGTLRDLLLAIPVFWIHEPFYLITCAIASMLTFFAAEILKISLPSYPLARRSWLGNIRCDRCRESFAGWS